VSVSESSSIVCSVPSISFIHSTPVIAANDHNDLSVSSLDFASVRILAPF